MTDSEYRVFTTNRVDYEWDWEEKDGEGEDADIVEHWFSDLPCDKPFAGPGDMVLVRNTGSASEGVEDRQWAYVDKDGVLPEYFCGSGGDQGAKVPKKCRQQFEGWLKGKQIREGRG